MFAHVRGMCVQLRAMFLRLRAEFLQARGRFLRMRGRFLRARVVLKTLDLAGETASGVGYTCGFDAGAGSRRLVFTGFQRLGVDGEGCAGGALPGELRGAREAGLGEGAAGRVVV